MDHLWPYISLKFKILSFFQCNAITTISYNLQQRHDSKKNFIWARYKDSNLPCYLYLKSLFVLHIYTIPISIESSNFIWLHSMFNNLFLYFFFFFSHFILFTCIHHTDVFVDYVGLSFHFVVFYHRFYIHIFAIYFMCRWYHGNFTLTSFCSSLFGISI